MTETSVVNELMYNVQNIQKLFKFAEFYARFLKVIFFCDVLHKGLKRKDFKKDFLIKVFLS